MVILLLFSHIRKDILVLNLMEKFINGLNGYKIVMYLKFSDYQVIKLHYIIFQLRGILIHRVIIEQVFQGHVVTRFSLEGYLAVTVFMLITKTT